MKQNDMFVQNVPCVVAASFVFRNICEIHVHGDNSDDDQIKFDVDSENKNQRATSSNVNTTDGREVREVLIEYFQNNPL